MATIARNVNYLHFKRRNRWSGQQAPEPMPEVFRTTLIHIDEPRTVSLSATQLNRTVIFRTNSIYDPNYSWGGNSALGYKTMGKFYTHYFVRKCWVRVEVIDGNEVQTSDLNTIIVPITWQDSFPTELASLTEIRMKFPRMRAWRKGVAANRQPKPRVTSFSPWEYQQVGNPYDDPDNFGQCIQTTSSAGNPANFYGCVVGVARDNLPWTEAALTVGIKVTMWFDVYFMRQPALQEFAASAGNFVPAANWDTEIEGLEEADDDGVPTLIERDTTATGAIADIAGHTDDP